MIDGITGTEHRLVAAEHFPGQTNSRLESGPILLYCGRLCNTVLTSNEKLIHKRVVVRHAAIDFRNGIGDVPRETESKRQILGDSPIILDEWPVNLPAPAGHRTVKCLIVLRQTRKAHKKIRRGITSDRVDRVRITAEIADKTGDQESVLERLGANVHLICPDIYTELDVMLSADDIQRIFYAENIGPSLERRKTAIAQRPVTASHQCADQPATECAWRANGGGATGTAQICPNDAKLCGFATAGSLRSNVVEDAVVTKAKLVHGRRRKDVRFTNRNIASVVQDSLVAAKGVGFGKPGRAPWHEGTRLIVTKAGE